MSGLGAFHATRRKRKATRRETGNQPLRQLTLGVITVRPRCAFRSMRETKVGTPSRCPGKGAAWKEITTFPKDNGAIQSIKTPKFLSFHTHTLHDDGGVITVFVASRALSFDFPFRERRFLFLTRVFPTTFQRLAPANMTNHYQQRAIRSRRTLPRALTFR